MDINISKNSTFIRYAIGEYLPSSLAVKIGDLARSRWCYIPFNECLAPSSYHVPSNIGECQTRFFLNVILVNKEASDLGGLIHLPGRVC